MDNNRLIGIFGGTFDPPHYGHLSFATLALEQLNLHHLFWVITPYSPHKQLQKTTLLRDRMAMVRMAIENCPSFSISDVDLHRPGPYYTVDSLEIIVRENPNTSIAFLMGSDLLSSFPYWIKVDKIVELCSIFAVAKRVNSSIKLSNIKKVTPNFEKKLRLIDLPEINASSHLISERISLGLSCRDLLPENIENYIKLHNLYQ